MITPRAPFALVFAPALSLAVAGCLTESALEALSGPDDSATASSSETAGGGTEGSGASGGGGGPDSGHVTLGSTTSTVTSATSGSASSDTDDGSSSDTDATAGDGSTTSIDPPMPQPAIVGHDLSPVPIKQNGPIHVTIVAEHAEGVRMVAGDGVEVELSPTPDPEVFVGEIPALTGFDNGDHLAVFRPWRGEDEGGELEVVYTLNLPTPGSELFFETGNLIGPGRVAAMGHLPSQAIVEFGMLADGQNLPRCYLRYRTQDGKWGPNDVVQVLPGSECEAIDLEVGDGGETYLLARWKTNNNDHRWWLGVIPSWGAAAQTISMGTGGEEAYAIAHHEGAVAVCGSIKTSEGDLDAIARVYREGKEEAVGLFDYETADTPKHWFSESARDCLFVDPDNLVLVGEAFGRHEWNEMTQRDRRFILPYEIGSDAEPKYLVAGPGPGMETQSVARGVARDEEGHLFIVGRVCEDDCVADGRLWIHDADGSSKSETALGVFSNDILSPRVVRWSPAGYAVVASGGAKGKEMDFTVRAYEPFMLDPVWSYAGPGSQQLNVALALSIGPYAEVCAGGFGANAYPAVACFGS